MGISCTTPNAAERAAFGCGKRSNWVFADGTITSSYNSSTGALTLSGVASAADYQAALDSVSFATTAPTGGSRTISWTANDGTLTALTVDVPIGVTAVVSQRGATNLELEAGHHRVALNPSA